MLKRASYALLAVAPLVLLADCGSSENNATDDAGAGTGASSGACSYPSAGQATKPVKAPPSTPTQSGDVAVTMKTSAGDIALTLNADSAPCTVNSFVSLATQGYFDDTSCHRLTTAASGIAVLQCGDPTGTSQGGPGYSFADELDSANALETDKKASAQMGSTYKTYPAGTVAMANGGPGTNGSQFFLVYADSPLQPNYTVFGTIAPAGLTVLHQVAQAGTADGGVDGAPKTPVKISAVSVG